MHLTGLLVCPTSQSDRSALLDLSGPEQQALQQEQPQQQEPERLQQQEQPRQQEQERLQQQEPERPQQQEPLPSLRKQQGSAQQQRR